MKRKMENGGLLTPPRKSKYFNHSGNRQSRVWAHWTHDRQPTYDDLYETPCRKQLEIEEDGCSSDDEDDVVISASRPRNGRALWRKGNPAQSEAVSEEEVIQVLDSQPGSETDSCTVLDDGVEPSIGQMDSSTDDCASFVVEDSDTDVEQEQRTSDRSLGRSALLEVRESVVERIMKMRRKLNRLDEELAALDGLHSGEERNLK